MNTTFDLNAYGVQEMSYQEMVETNGGFITKLIVAAVLIMLPLAAHGGGQESADTIDAITCNNQDLI